MDIMFGNNNLQFYDAYFCGKYFYFSALQFNGLFKAEINKNNAEFLGHFKEENIWQRNLHRQILNLDNRIYFIPYNGHGIHIYDLNTGDMHYIMIKEKHEASISYSNAYILNGYILLIPSNLQTPFIKFSIEDEKMEMLENLNLNINNLLSNEITCNFDMHSSWILDSTLYLTVLGSNIVLLINLLSFEAICKKISDHIHLRNIFYDNGSFWFTMTDSYGVVKWYLNSDHCEKILMPVMGKKEMPFMLPLFYDNNLYLLPSRENCLWKLNVYNMQWEDITEKLPYKFFREVEYFTLFLGYKICLNGDLLLYPRAGNGLLRLKKKDGKFNYIPIEYNADFLSTRIEISKAEMRHCLTEGTIMVENNKLGVNLENMIYELPSSKVKGDILYDKINGKKIWNVLKNV